MILKSKDHSSPSTNSYRFSSSKLRTGQLATDVIVFVVGGGNYVEYQNVHDYGKSKGLQRIVYGCTEMVSPKKFVEQVRAEW